MIAQTTAPAESHLASNLAAHQQQWGFAPLLGASGGTTPVRSGFDGPDRPALQTADGRWVTVHDDRDPLGEAADWIEQTAGVHAASLVCVIGAGLGYAIEQLAARVPSIRILVLEPEPGLLRRCLDRRDWTPLIESGRLMMLCGPAFEGRANAWRLVGSAENSPAIMVHPVIAQARRDATRTAAQVIGQAIAGARANQEARTRFAAPYLLNTLRNLPRFSRARDVQTLFGRHAGTAAVIAAAGPSLNRNLDALSKIDGWRDRTVVIAVDTALKPMLAAGMPPHYVVGVDPSEKNSRTLSALPPVEDTHLVAEASLDPRCFTSFDDRTFLFTVSDTHQPWPWLKALGLGVGTLRAWGSVLTTAYDLAVKLGCDPIVFIGADLAYTGGQPYCRGTVYEENWAAAVASGQTLEDVWKLQLPKTELVELQDVNEQRVSSSKTLIAFREWLAAEARTAPHRFVNATGGGILHGEGVRQEPLEAALAGSTRQAPGHPSGSAAATMALATEAGLASAVAAIVSLAVAPPAQPLGDWMTFANGVATTADVATALRTVFPELFEAQPALDAALNARAAVAAAEAATWAAYREANAAARGGHGTPQRRPSSPGDWAFGPTPPALLPEGPVAAFRSFHALHVNARRLEHLATLDLPLRERRVLEVGAGVGDLTEFFLDRGCCVHTTDARMAQVAILRDRFAAHPLATVDYLNLDPPPADLPGLFDLVFCYGLLYHVSDPAAAIEYLSRACTDLLLVDTVVGPDDADATNVVIGDPAIAGGAVSGRAARPGRAWVHARLLEQFAYVYVPATQPNHYEYPVDWTMPSPFSRRLTFVASRRRLDSALLSTGLPDRQRRH